MLLIGIFIFFSTIFGFLYQTSRNTFYENMLPDLLTSFSSYVRIFGYLPTAETNNQTPWGKIGISEQFFGRNTKYTPNAQYLNANDLIPIDCLHWILKKIVYMVDYSKQDKTKQHIMHLAPHALDLEYDVFEKKIELAITNETLLKFMNFDKAFLKYTSYELHGRAAYPSHNALIKNYIA